MTIVQFTPFHRFYRYAKIPFFSIILLFIFACNPTKKLTENQYLVEKNIIVDKNSGLDKELIESYIRQKPNRKIFRLFYFHTWLYNKVNIEKALKKKTARNIKYDKINLKRTAKTEAKNKKIDDKRDARNQKRIAQGKDPLPQKKHRRPHLKDKEKLTFGEKLQEIGETAVILDTFLTKVSTEQIKKFFNNNGFFNARVKDSIVYEPGLKKNKKGKHKKRAQVYYIVRSSLPYNIRKVSYKIEDPELAVFIMRDTAACKIKPGARYEGDLIIAERERIYKYQINHGYYEFAQDFIYFLVDSNLSSTRQIDVTIGVKKFAYKKELEHGGDTILFRNHIRYYLNNIYAITDYNPYIKTDYADTAVYEKGDNRYLFLYNKKMQFRKSVLSNLITISPGQLYSYETAEETYRRLSDIKAFKNINVVFIRVPGTTDKLDVVIQMSPVMRQAFTAETEGTNTSGNLGIAGSLIYQNRNLGHGAELLEVKLKGGLTAQKNFGTQTSTTINPANVTNVFNTFQFGPELNLYFPRMFFPLSLPVFHWGKNSSPKTILASSANYQKRPEFGRTLLNISYGFSWKIDYWRFNLVPFEANVIKVSQISPAFAANLAASNDFFLKNSFRDHITTVTRMTFFYNNQNKPKIKRPIYFKANAESSGNLLRAFGDATGQAKDTTGSYLIAGTPFAQFLRLDVDYRNYIPVGRANRLVVRTFFGIGHPSFNLRVLPYEKSFFAGGPNSVRAWKARSLGPGGSNADNGNANFDKLGDVQIEANVEYRFNIYKMLNGALFVDAGNVWLRKLDTSKPLGDFAFNRFYKELGVGGGMGIRADFSFFIIRLDASCRLHDPSRTAGDRWMFTHAPLKTTVVNFGIGYPF